jgi:hypothetical protein
MNLHPELATALVAQRQRELLQRAERHRMLSRRPRPVSDARRVHTVRRIVKWA